ncbi:periplasmic binding family protein, partial [Candidatus Erwinia dacicola]
NSGISLPSPDLCNSATPKLWKTQFYIGSDSIAVVALSLRSDTRQAAQLSPQLSNEEQAYNDGLKKGIRLIGDVVNRQPQAEKLIAATFSQCQQVAKRLQTVPQAQRIRVYIANPELTTYGSGKYTGLIRRGRYC